MFPARDGGAPLVPTPMAPASYESLSMLATVSSRDAAMPRAMQPPDRAHPSGLPTQQHYAPMLTRAAAQHCELPPQPPAAPPGDAPPLGVGIDPRTFEAWLDPTVAAFPDNASLFGSDFDPAGAAYFASLFGQFGTTFTASRAQSPGAETPYAPLLPLVPWRANLVATGWRLKFVSDQRFRPEAQAFPQEEVDPKQTAAALSCELAVPRGEDAASVGETIPTLDFVDLAIAQYFARFHGGLPVLHRPTFSRLTTSPLLLLSVLSLGAYFLNTPDARARAKQIFERLQRLVAVVWVKHVQQSAAAAIVMAQLALLGQSYACMSGEVSHLLIWQAFHQSVLSWARWSGLTAVGAESADALEAAQRADGAELGRVWRAWVDRERARRVALALVIHENELSARSCTPPMAWHRSMPGPCSDDLFEAPDEVAWRAVLTAEAARPPPAFSSYFQLAVGLAELRIEAAALDALPDLGLGAAARSQFEDRLRVMERGADSLARSSRLQLRGLGSSALALLHSTWLSLDVDMDLVERCAGREGPVPPIVSHDLAEWAGSARGRRAAVRAAHTLLHAGALGGLLVESGLHAARVAFQAALALFCFVGAAPMEPSAAARPPVDLLACDVAAFAADGHGRRVVVPGLLDISGASRRLDVMSLLLSAAPVCARASTLGLGATLADIITNVATNGL